MQAHQKHVSNESISRQFCFTWAYPCIISIQNLMLSFRQIFFFTANFYAGMNIHNRKIKKLNLIKRIQVISFASYTVYYHIYFIKKTRKN